jgi:hypothetical protein
MGTMKEHHITDLKLYSCRCLMGISNGNISYRILNLITWSKLNCDGRLRTFITRRDSHLAVYISACTLWTEVQS